jgi:hypothetical protein
VLLQGFDASSNLLCRSRIRCHVVGLLRSLVGRWPSSLVGWLVDWLVGTALLRSLVCRWYSSVLPSFLPSLVVKPFFLWYLFVGLRSLVHRSWTFVRSNVGCRPSFVSSLLVDLRSFVRRSRALWWSLLRLRRNLASFGRWPTPPMLLLLLLLRR